MNGKQSYPLYFFTDINTNISKYCLLNIKQYYSKKKDNKEICYIDPSVHELLKSDEYSKIDILYKLLDDNLLLPNEFISIDYPCDMNANYTDLFIKKSYDNNIKYKDNSKYICTIQFKFKDFEDFIYQTERLRYVWDGNITKIIGMGNLCRIFYADEFMNKVLLYIRDNMQGKSVHFYGIGLRVIKSKIFREILNGNIIVSVDSTKWTRAVNQNLKDRVKAYNCNKQTRDLFFVEYMNNIKKSGIEVHY